MQEKARDPVCGAKVERDSPRRDWFNNTEFYFCSEACRRKFRTAPDDYVPPQT